MQVLPSGRPRRVPAVCGRAEVNTPPFVVDPGGPPSLPAYVLAKHQREDNDIEYKTPDLPNPFHFALYPRL